MGLRETAESDLGGILEDSVTGFGWAIAVTSPALVTVNLTGFSDDISQVIDPETGGVVSGRLITASLRMSSLNAAFSELPVGINGKASKPWLFEFLDIAGVSAKFKVVQSNPDRALGIVSFILELYK